MGQHLVLLSVAVTLGGCSLIYNPSNLPPLDKDGGADAPVDVEVILDADPTMLELTSVAPAVIYEGDGVDGSRPAVIVIHGKQLAMGATVSVTEHGTGAPVGSVTIDNAKAAVSANGFDLAVPVTVGIDANTAAIALDVTVTQDTAVGMVSRTLPANPADPSLLTLQGLEQLESGSPVLTGGVHEYARVAVAGLSVAPGDPAALQIHSHSSVTITGTLAANASGKQQGAGGSAGPSGAGALQTGDPGNGPAGGKPSGGGGGYGTPGEMGSSGAGGGTAGDPAIKAFATNVSSSGAAGNGGATGAGGAGGGGGGTIFVVADGMATLGVVQATGGDGGNPTAIGSGSPGGGGSGGTVLVRAGNTLAVAEVEVTGGVGKTGGTVGHGGLGRVRFDAPNVDITTDLHGATVYRGPMFAADTVLITRNDHVPLTVTGQNAQSFRYYFTGESGSLRGPYTVSILAGQNMFPLDAPLFRGLNKVCLLVADSALDAPAEAQHCISIAYLYTP